MKSNLNLLQLKITKTIKGPIMIISGAGSGKTRVIIHRIAYLIEKGINPNNILALTFTNKAAKEMKDRIIKLINNEKAKNIWMGTFHSIFSKIIRNESFYLNYSSNYTIYDKQDSENIIKKIIEDLNLEKDVYKTKILLSRISYLKNNLINYESYINNSILQLQDKKKLMIRMGDIYKIYTEICIKSQAMDFDDLLLRTNELLTKEPFILNKYQQLFKYIMVDEYQDTNYSQYIIIKKLSSIHKNICVVGDDAQSIYSFRGANIQNILNFKSDYPNAKIFRLEQNYRSTDQIVQASNDVISHNKNQFKKKIWTKNKNGEKIGLYIASSEIEEANFLVNTLIKFKNKNKLENKDFAILYRTNTQSRIIEEKLCNKKIPYYIYGGLSFYQRKEIKDILAYLRLLINKKDEEALLRIINYPNRGIGKITINKLRLLSINKKITIYEILNNPDDLNLNNKTLIKVKNFTKVINKLSLELDKGVYFIAKEIIKNFNLLDSLHKDNTYDGISRYENVQELINSIKSYVIEQSKLDNGNISLSSFLEKISLSTDIVDNEINNKVSLMTIHLSKGLEFPIIFIVGLEENLFPSSFNLKSQNNIEEERRLFYVALTRAKKQAILSYSIKRYRWGKIIDTKPSRFIKEIDKNRLHKLNS